MGSNVILTLLFDFHLKTFFKVSSFVFHRNKRKSIKTYGKVFLG